MFKSQISKIMKRESFKQYFEVLPAYFLEVLDIYWKFPEILNRKYAWRSENY